MKHEQGNAPESASAKKLPDDTGSQQLPQVEPIVHEEQADERSAPKHKPTIVGIGASAGGLKALQTFFSRVPSDSNLAFVVVVHLSPRHESHLSDLLQPHVKVPVEQVAGTISIEANHVYVIPPNANLSAIDTHLRLSQLEQERNERAPIDHFFRTLAATHDGHGVGVILTGTGSDGTLGIKDIKAKGGLIIVQDPNEAEFDGMPQSAIATGLADWILPLAEIPEAIIRYDRTAPKVSVPARDADESVDSVDGDEQSYLQKIFVQLRARTDRDFSRYKQSTILRRISRRMQLNYIDDLPTYIEKLRSDSEELKALADDCLITVTNFFRDPEVFERLQKEVIPRLFKNKSLQDTIRVWSVGCATGEEAYSLAMLLAEESARHDSPPRIQIFASDLHKRSLERGRDGYYPGDIDTDVSADRLRRFFQKENGGYRVEKEIRDLVVFSPHNLLGDPPFSRIDLITCRNLLIYLQRHAQRDVVELFHYSLNPEGTLVLGTAEILDPSDLFRTEDKRLCFYRKRNVPVPEPRLPVFPILAARQSSREPVGVNRTESPAHAALHHKALEMYAPPSILVGPDDKVVHLSENAGRYLVVQGGEMTTTAYRLVRVELRFELRTALQAARQNRTATDSQPISVRFNGDVRAIVMHVRPLPDPDPDGFALVIFEERDLNAAATEPAKPEAGVHTVVDRGRIDELEKELSVARQRSQTLIEEYETSREEMQASAEEMQSTNEELRSTMEELETSKEELQSMNEELQTVNQENRHKVAELAQLSSDLQNLLTATEIATLFLDRELRILRFTPKLAELFNVRVHDRGRPISDLTHRLGSTDLHADAEAVLSRLVPVEREVRDEAGHWFLTRLLPYRSTEDRILGVVITFVDITARRNAEETLRKSEERLRRMISVDVVGVLIFDGDGTLIDSNEAFQQMSGYSREEITSKTLTWRTFTPPEYVAGSERQLVSLKETGHLGPYEKEYIRKDGSRSWLLFAGASLGDGTIVEYCIDVMDRKKVEAELQRSKRYAETIIETLHEPLLVLTPDLLVRSANPAFYRHFAVSAEDTIGHTVYELGNRQWKIPELRKALEEVLPQKRVFEDFEVTHTFERIGKRTMLLNARQLEDLELILLGIRDVSKERAAAEALSRSEQRFRLLVDSVRDYAVFQMDLNGNILSWNSGAERLLGWTEQEVIGKDASIIFTPEDIAAGEPGRELEGARTNGSAEDERWHLRKNDTRFFASGVLTQVCGPKGNLLGFAKVMRDITARKENEEQLKQSVKVKSTLVREIHHRVKNNLQVIASLLSMQASYTQHAEVLRAFEEAEGRLRAIARIHERLYASSDLSEVEFSSYLQNLTREMLQLHSSTPDKISLEMDATEIVLDIEQAIPLGLIANELIINSLKHGLQNGSGALRVRFSYVPGKIDPGIEGSTDDGWAAIEVSDAGLGFPPGFNPESTATFGLKLVSLLVGQLRGRFEISDGPGARSVVTFPLRHR